MKQNHEFKSEKFTHIVLDVPNVPVEHETIFERLLAEITPIDFRESAEMGEDDKLAKKHYLICCIENILSIAKQNQWDMCRNAGFIYLYNGAFWSCITDEELEGFLGKAAEKMGVDRFDARHFQFREQLHKQFIASATLTKPNPEENVTLINLKNGTLEVSPTSQILRSHRSSDFLTYQLPFDFDEKAECPIFFEYLNRVQPEIDLQNILAEFLGFLFIRTKVLKMEKVMLLYGTGANGKSVFFEIVNALLGEENVSSFSLQSLCDSAGYYRAMIANKLVNYASEISKNMNSDIFKSLASGEPVEARPIYKEPIMIRNYAKLIFNCNELPKDVEQTDAFFRRFLIIPFMVTIPPSERDKELSTRITRTELPGILNWVMKGLDRLLKQKDFTESVIANQALEQYKKESDSILIFIDDKGYSASEDNREFMMLKDFFNEYNIYCRENNHRPVSYRKFSERLRNNGFFIERINAGLRIFIK